MISFRCRSSSSSSTRKNTLSDVVNMEVPDHDLEPPKFSRRALERLLNDWAAVRAMIMTGHKEESPPSSASTDDINFMQFQGHTTHLDKFTYCLLVKLATQVSRNRNWATAGTLTYCINFENVVVTLYPFCNHLFSCYE